MRKRRRFFKTPRPHDYSVEYMYFEALEDMTVSLSTNNIMYSLNNGASWTELPAGTSTPTVKTGEKIYFKFDGISTTFTSSTSGCGTFSTTGKFNVCGNLRLSFIGTTNESIPYCRALFSSSKVVNATNLILPWATVGEYSYYEMFGYCSSLIESPALPAVNLASECYDSMFINCFSITRAPELPATILANGCYSTMFRNCTKLIVPPELPASTLVANCYSSMFFGCSSLTKSPILHADILPYGCYDNMFTSCSSLTYITMLATSGLNQVSVYWIQSVASTGTFVKHPDATIPYKSETTSSFNICVPDGWEIKNRKFTPSYCTSLTISAENISGNSTHTTVHYKATIIGINESNMSETQTIVGTAISDEFPQNMSTINPITRTVSYTYMGVTATTTITQGVWVSSNFTINLNSNWQQSSISNPDSAVYDLYESYSNKGTNNSGAIMYIDIVGYTEFEFYIRSYAESNYDYVMVSQLDQELTYNTSYSNTTLVKAHTRGNQQSGTALSNYTKVTFSGIDGGSHRICIIYRKDSSSHSGDDRGYLLINRNQ